MNNTNFIPHMRFIIDTNSINSRQKNHHLNQLEKWAEEGLIELIATETTLKELKPYRSGFRKGCNMIFTISECCTSEELNVKKTISAILFPGGSTDSNQDNDVEIVFNARKYNGILVTNDGNSKSQPDGILGNKTNLEKIGVKVVTAAEAVKLVQLELMNSQMQPTLKKDRPDMNKKYQYKESEMRACIVEVYNSFKKEKDSFLRAWKKTQLIYALGAFNWEWYAACVCSLKNAMASIDDISRKPLFEKLVYEEAAKISDSVLDDEVFKISSIVL